MTERNLRIWAVICAVIFVVLFLITVSIDNPLIGKWEYVRSEWLYDVPNYRNETYEFFPDGRCKYSLYGENHLGMLYADESFDYRIDKSKVVFISDDTTIIGEYEILFDRLELNRPHSGTFTKVAGSDTLIPVLYVLSFGSLLLAIIFFARTDYGAKIFLPIRRFFVEEEKTSEETKEKTITECQKETGVSEVDKKEELPVENSTIAEEITEEKTVIFDEALTQKIEESETEDKVIDNSTEKETDVANVVTEDVAEAIVAVETKTTECDEEEIKLSKEEIKLFKQFVGMFKDDKNK